ncbi:MAG: ribonuclease HI [Firmicutes bacterium]|nr:ribonuclease HI [Bacillota bacterium]
METLRIYTDGACSGNPGPGGWAAILLFGEKIKEISGFQADTTNNQMELRAAIEGLKAVKKVVPTELYSDSSYVVKAFNDGWIFGWQKNGWKTANKEPVKNKELWVELFSLVNKIRPKFIWVKGHASNQWNNRADELAVSEIKKRLP